MDESLSGCINKIILSICIKSKSGSLYQDCGIDKMYVFNSGKPLKI